MENSIFYVQQLQKLFILCLFLLLQDIKKIDFLKLCIVTWLEVNVLTRYTLKLMSINVYLIIIYCSVISWTHLTIVHQLEKIKWYLKKTYKQPQPPCPLCGHWQNADQAFSSWSGGEWPWFTRALQMQERPTIAGYLWALQKELLNTCIFHPSQGKLNLCKIFYLSNKEDVWIQEDFLCWFFIWGFHYFFFFSYSYTVPIHILTAQKNTKNLCSNQSSVFVHIFFCTTSSKSLGVHKKQL